MAALYKKIQVIKQNKKNPKLVLAILLHGYFKMGTSSSVTKMHLSLKINTTINKAISQNTVSHITVKEITSFLHF